MKMSNDVSALFESLSIVQGLVSNVVKDTKGYGYSYAELDSVLETSRPLLASNGLSITYIPCISSSPDKGAMRVIIAHKSGQYIIDKMEMNIERIVSKEGKNKTTLAQATGSVYSYMRRYSDLAILRIAQTDDDGSEGQNHSKSNVVTYNRVNKKADNWNDKSELIEKIYILLEQQGNVDKFTEMLRKKNFKSAADAPILLLQQTLIRLEKANDAFENEAKQLGQYEEQENV